MKTLHFFLLAATVLLGSFGADAAPLGSRRALLAAAPGPGWSVDGVGHVRSLRQLGAALDANPSADVTMLGSYNAARDGFILRNVVTTAYTGVFDCSNNSIRNLSFVNNETVSLVPPLGIGFFNTINGGTIQNCDGHGTVTQTSTSLAGVIQTYRVAGWAAYLQDATATNVKGNFSVRANGYFNYDAVLFADVRGTSTFSNLECQGNIYLSLVANNVVSGCVASFFQGTLDTMRVYNLTIYAETGSSPGQTQNCSTPPCPTTGSYMGGAIGVSGYSGTQCITATNITVESTVTLTNTTNNGLGVTGGVTGPMFCATLYDSTSAATVTGATAVGGAVGRLQQTDSLAYNLVNTGTVNGTVAHIGGVAGLNNGTLRHAYSTGNIVAPLAVNVGNALGYNYADAVAHHIFGWGDISCAGACGGNIGRNHPTGAVLDQMYSLSPISGGSTVGGEVGVCFNLAGISSLYWNTDTSGYATGCGSNASPGAAITGKTSAQFLSGLPAGFDGDWLQNANAGGYPYLTGLPVPPAPPTPTPRKYLVLTPGSTSPLDLSVVAPDFNCNNNTIRAWGAGGNGGTATVGGGSGGGGGGGAYASIVNFCPTTPSTPIPFSVAAGGSGTGTFTYFNAVTTLKAASGGNGAPAVNGGGGAAASSAGSFIRGGANGGTTGSGTRSGGGGGGAGGPNGAGAAGASGFGNTTVGGGGGGGGANGGTAGSNGAAGVGGNGGRSYDPTPPITAAFTASMSGTTITVSAVSSGTITVDAIVTGTGVPANTTILSAINATDWLVSTSATVASTAMTSATPAGYTAGGVGSSSTATPGANGSNGSGGGGGSSSTSAASVGGVGSCSLTVSGVNSGSGGGGGGGLGVTLPTGAAGGNGGCSGGGGGGGGRGITTGGAGGTGGDGSIVIEWTP